MSNTREEIDDLIHAWAGDDRLEVFWGAINRLVDEEKQSALAGARKALERIAQAPGDNIGVWARSIARAALNGDSHAE